jgi:peptidoglycan lytic transglycosylase
MKPNLSWLPVETGRERVSRVNLKTFAIVSVLVISGLSLTGCGTSYKFGKEYGKASPYWQGSGPIPKGGGRYKVGNPYTVNGKKYYPREDPGYDRVGKASWYGPTFNRRQTANGEYFDMTRLTGAHPTLPLPSFVRVTNLKNNKSVVIRVNDRGPYSSERVIDVSKKAADVLDFRRQGTTRVRVQYVGRAPLNGDDYYTYTASRKPQPSPTRVAAQTAPRRQYNQPEGSGDSLFIQAASFASRGNARRLKNRLEILGPVRIVASDINGQIFYRVRVGPMTSNYEAKMALRQIVDAGNAGATLIIE